MASQTIRSISAIHRSLRFLSIRLQPFAEAVQLQKEATSLRVRLSEKHERWQQAVEERVAATAEITYRDEQLDLLISSLAREALVLTNGDRTHPTYRKLMPTSPTLAMKSIASDTQTRYVKTVLAVLKDDADLAALEGFVPALETAQAALESAQARRAELGVPESRAHTDRQLVVDEAQRFLGLARAQLTLLFPSDKNLVKSFFPPTSRTSTRSNVNNDDSSDDLLTDSSEDDSVE